MTVTANPIDICKLAEVKAWANVQGSNDDQQIQDCITAFSAYVLHLTGRGPMDGSFPVKSPFVEPVTYDEFYDGSGTFRQLLRNWPITAVSQVIINGTSIPQSSSVNSWGWVIDGDAKFISLRGGSNASVATFQNYRYAGRDASGPGFSSGIQNVEVGYTAGFNGVPLDLEMAARKAVALNYVRRSWLGQKSQSMAAGAGTVSFGQWELEEDVLATIRYYRRMTG